MYNCGVNRYIIEIIIQSSFSNHRKRKIKRISLRESLSKFLVSGVIKYIQINLIFEFSILIFDFLVLFFNLFVV
jgi:hypothetical protein